MATLGGVSVRQAQQDLAIVSMYRAFSERKSLFPDDCPALLRDENRSLLWASMCSVYASAKEEVMQEWGSHEALAQEYPILTPSLLLPTTTRYLFGMINLAKAVLVEEPTLHKSRTNALQQLKNARAVADELGVKWLQKNIAYALRPTCEYLSKLAESGRDLTGFWTLKNDNADPLVQYLLVNIFLSGIIMSPYSLVVVPTVSATLAADTGAITELVNAVPAASEQIGYLIPLLQQLAAEAQDPNSGYSKTVAE